MQLLENWIKNIHIFLKKHFFYFFLNPPLQNIWRQFLSSFCVCICKSFLLFYMFFCTRIYHLKQASQALVNVTDMSSFCRILILKNRTSGIVKTEFILCICLCILICISFCHLSAHLFIYFFLPKRHRYKYLFNTPDRKPWTQKKLQIVTRKATVRWKIMYLFFLFFWLKHLLKKHSRFL